MSHRSRYGNRSIFSLLWLDLVFIFIVIVLIVRGAEVESCKEVELTSGIDALCSALNMRCWVDKSNNVGGWRFEGEPTRFCSSNAYFQFPSQLAIHITKKSTDLVPPGLLRNELVANSSRGELVARFSVCGEHSTRKVIMWEYGHLISKHQHLIAFHNSESGTLLPHRIMT